MFYLKLAKILEVDKNVFYLKLTKTKTLSETDLMTIESLGYKIEMHQLSWKNIKH